MREAIKLAIEGGWIFQDRTGVWQEWHERHPINENLERMWCDPKWWQALGKSLGWDEGELYDESYGDGKYSQDWMWQHQWHKFIDHLAEGKDPEEFFAELLKP